MCTKRLPCLALVLADHQDKQRASNECASSVGYNYRFVATRLGHSCEIADGDEMREGGGGVGGRTDAALENTGRLEKRTRKFRYSVIGKGCRTLVNRDNERSDLEKVQTGTTLRERKKKEGRAKTIRR